MVIFFTFQWMGSPGDPRDLQDAELFTTEIPAGESNPACLIIRNAEWFLHMTIYRLYIYIYIWANYNDLTATSLGMMVSKGNHPQMTLFQVSELL